MEVSKERMKRITRSIHIELLESLINEAHENNYSSRAEWAGMAHSRLDRLKELEKETNE